ncbi:hypothetical protein SDC9_150220 [bioreactor metagenome]|uniref:Uncharacterized protein n=1 Tax=bioreactor metagenome TaxID=1076179 RepID=A0A645EMH0_9ZZZZ
MEALPEEYAGRAVQLRNNDTFSSVDDESTFLGHVGNSTEIYILDDRSEVFVIRVGAI